MRISILTLVAAAGVAVPLTAIADKPYYSYDDEPALDPYTAADHAVQPEVGFGMLIGQYSVGRVAGTAVGFHLDGGVRWHRLALLAEYDFLSFTEDTDISLPKRAFVHRAGANLRYSFGVLSKRDFPVRGDFWVEAGAGHQLVTWVDGGKLHRNDLSLGIGSQLTVRFGPNKRKKLGLIYAVKFLIADRPDLKMQPSGCAGPCDEASPMIPVDLGIFFNVAIPFGQ
jgi:hypothetical protein